MWKLYSDYGASLRSLLVHAHDPHNYKDWVNAEINKLSPGSLLKLLLDPSAATEGSHYVITTGPLPGNHSKPYRTFTSPYVFEECYKQIYKDQAEMLKIHYNQLCSNPTTSAATGMIFKYRAHQFLQKKKTINLFPILGRLNPSYIPSYPPYLYYSQAPIIYDDYKATNSRKDKKQVNLPNLEEHIIIDKTEAHIKYNTYYRPEHSNSNSIDSWVLIQQGLWKPPIFIMFQITTDVGKCELTQASLDIIDQLDIPKDALRWLVVFSPKEVHPEIGPKMVDYLKKSVDIPLNSVHIPVFHYPINSDKVV